MLIKVDHGTFSSVGFTLTPPNVRETEKGRNGDSAWPIWGLAMRIMQAVCRLPGMADVRWDCIVTGNGGICRKIWWRNDGKGISLQSR